MVKKSGTFIFLILLIGYFVHGSLVDIYKKGLIKLEADPDFGRKTSGDESIYDTRCDLLRAPDGSFFVAVGTEHCLYRFSAEGKFIGKYGQEGQGPGDLYVPGDLSVLDNRYLVIGEYAATRRVSLFDLEGNFAKLLKTERNALTTVALKDNKIAYTTFEYGPMKNQTYEFTTIIIVKDVKTGEEAAIDQFRTQRKLISAGGGSSLMTMGSGEMIITPTRDGNLLVGVTMSDELKIYSPLGELLRSLRLRMEPVPATRDYIQRYKDFMIQDMEERNMPKSLIDAVKKTPYVEEMFGKHLPYFKDILVDSEGNILVCKTTDCIGDCNEVFQVYSPEGKYICDVTVDNGIYDVTIDRRFKNIVFASDAVYGLFPLKDNEEAGLQLIRVKLH